MRKAFYLVVVIVLGYISWQYYFRFKMVPAIIVKVNSGSNKSWIKTINRDRLFKSYLKRMRKKYSKNAPFLQFDIKTGKDETTIDLYAMSNNKKDKSLVRITSDSSPADILQTTAIAMTILKGLHKEVPNRDLSKACEMALKVSSKDQVAILKALKDNDFSNSEGCTAWLIKFTREIPAENREIVMNILMAQTALRKHKDQIADLCVPWLLDNNPKVAKMSSVLLTTTSRGSTAEYLIPLLKNKNISENQRVLIIQTISHDKKISPPVIKLLRIDMKKGGSVGKAAADALSKHGVH
jgi:hypothetical protein